MYNESVSAYVLELCCFEWFQNTNFKTIVKVPSFRAVLFRMVPKPKEVDFIGQYCFRAVLFRMVPKPAGSSPSKDDGFRAVLFRMVPKRWLITFYCFKQF